VDLDLVLDMVRDSDPDRTVITVGASSLSAAELHERAGALAQVLLTEGADALVHVAGNSFAFPVALFAAARAGVPLVPLNYRLSAEQLDRLVAAHPNALIVHDSSAPDALRSQGLSVEQVLALPAAASAGPSDDELPAVLLYTSGTTAEPKAAVLRHRHLLAYLLGTVDFGAAAAEEAALVTVPPYHVAGVANLLSNLFAGRRIVYLDGFTARTWVDTVRREGVTQAMVVPTMLARVVDLLEQQPVELPELRSLSYGGARMPLPILQRALALLPSAGFVNAYGLTETSSTIALLGPQDHRSALASDDKAVRARLGSVGKLLPGIELEVRDELGAVLPAGERGLLYLRGDQVSGEYRGGSALEDGWFPTRDLGWLDEGGFLFVEGRADDTIIRGGENIAPAEIEDVLLEHVGVADVVVVGVPDDEWGQRIAAVVVAAPGAAVGADELREWVRARLRGSKTPDFVEFRTELPRTDTGKVLRRSILADLIPA
jgi:acyl-CoA synthetase (AMP-forming)/AMP-acid ligase II